MPDITSSHIWIILTCTNISALMLCAFSGNKVGSLLSFLCASMCYLMLSRCKKKDS